MIKIDNLSYSFPQKELYKNISFTLEDGQHCAFIGTSGSGKSTLVDMIMDPERYLFEGTLERDPHCRIGYVSQLSGLDSESTLTVFEYLAEKFLQLQHEITSLCTEMETSTELEPLLEKYQLAFDAFGAIGGDDYEHNIRTKLNLANLTRQENLPVAKLSGGEFKLVQVIKEMLPSPDLIIMDEPDAFLDFENLTSLKNLINSHKGTLLIITHNRYLLNYCFDKILHLENTEIQEFDGRFIDYNFALLQRKIELQELAAIDTEEIERNERIIEQLRATATINHEASKGKALYARIKIQERLEARRIKAPFLAIKQPAIRLVTDKVIEDAAILSVTDYSVSFEDLLLENVSFELKPTDKVALVGANGTGKTTLLRDIYKKELSTIHIHEEAKVAYLSQLQGEMLKESNTIYDEFFDAGFQSYEEISSYLAGFGFEEETMNQRIGSLSGGEKNIIQLVKISAGKADLLLLDEPTSHLDTYSQLALEQAIQKYQGAIFMISHDFYTIANCMDYVLIIEDKTIRKVSIRKFRKMIYADHFDKDYVEHEQKKKTIETKIELALKGNDFVKAKVLAEELEELIPLL